MLQVTLSASERAYKQVERTTGTDDDSVSVDEFPDPPQYEIDLRESMTRAGACSSDDVHDGGDELENIRRFAMRLALQHRSKRGAICRLLRDGPVNHAVLYRRLLVRTRNADAANVDSDDLDVLHRVGRISEGRQPDLATEDLRTAESRSRTHSLGGGKREADAGVCGGEAYDDAALGDVVRGGVAGA